MNLKKALAKYLNYKMTGEYERFYEPSNPSYGYCAYCDNKLFDKGLNEVNCEYHYLKRKYRTISDNCRLAKDANRKPSMYTKIKCKMSWDEFLEWCIVNKDYRKMYHPTLTRINKKKHFDIGNIMWEENFRLMFDAVAKKRILKRKTYNLL